MDFFQLNKCLKKEALLKQANLDRVELILNKEGGVVATAVVHVEFYIFCLR